VSVGGGVDRVELGEELGVVEAGVALSAVGVEDPQRRPPPWWAGAIARDDHLRSLADDVASEPDPRSTGELEADPGRLADGCRQPMLGSGPLGSRIRAGLRRRLEDDERDPGPPGERREAPESIAESRSRAATATIRGAGSAIRRSPRAAATRQVDDEQVDRPAREQRAGDGQALIGIGGRQDDEPLRLHAASHGLHGIEGRREVQPGHDRAGGLHLRGEPQGQRRPSARDVTPDREAHPARHAAGTEDRVELGEAGRMDAIEIDRPVDRRPHRRAPSRLALPVRILERDRRERPDDLADEAGRGRTPARSKGRQRRVQAGRGSTHGAASIEQMFE
jgi:hypothetical protein